MALSHGGNVFAVAREHGWDWHDVLDCSASINPLGPAPGVVPAIQEALDRIVHYPERESPRLRRALAALWHVDENQILLGNGATELIFFLARMFSGQLVSLSLPVFGEFHRAFPAARVDSTQLLVLTRPTNPTGWTLPLEDIKPSVDPILLDESFLEFSGHESAATLLCEQPNLIILRSLTKFYALPGLRIGALIASPKTIERWEQHREPWQVNVLAEEAALAAIADTDHAARSIELVRTERAWLLGQLSTIPGADPQPGDANFLYVKVPNAAQLCGHLLRYKILVRNCAGWPGLTDEAVRIAVRLRHENERLLKAWREFRCD